MSRRYRWCLGVSVATLCAACGQEEAPTNETALSALAPGMVARVGAVDIRSDTVERIAKSQKVGRKGALDNAVFDTLFAQQRRSELSARELRMTAVPVLSRAMLEALWEEVQKAPINAEELAAFTDKHWVRYNRPKGYVVVHAVAQFKEDAKPEVVQAAKQIAKKLHTAAQDAAALARREPAPKQKESAESIYSPSVPDPAEAAFKKATKAVDKGDVKVTIETLAPFAIDGRILLYGAPNEPRYAVDFCEPAAALGERGRLSDPVKTAFGYHVILLLATTAEYHAGEVERRKQLRPEILNMRVRRAEREVLSRTAKSMKPSFVSNSGELLMQVKIQ